MSKHIPILFSTAMVPPILEGRKTQTRRVMKPQPHQTHDQEEPEFWYPTGNKKFNGEDTMVDNDSDFFLRLCPYGQPGDVLWVRETWRGHEQDFGTDRFEYKATEKINLIDKWKPSIHMPKSACRLFLKVKSVRVERLHDISPEDVIQEGVKYPVKDKGDGTAIPMMRISGEHNAYEFLPENHKELSADELHNALLKATFAELWCDINGYDSYIANPWVWVVEFERCDMPDGFLK